MTCSTPAQGPDRYLDFEDARGVCFRIRVEDDPSDPESFTLRVTPLYRGLESNAAEESPSIPLSSNKLASATAGECGAAGAAAATGVSASPEPTTNNAPQLPGLTARERDVALLVAKGHTNAEIAEMLCISLSTVKSHVRNIFTKMDISTRTALVARLHNMAL